MPLVTLTVRKGKSGEFKSAVLRAVHGALIASGVPEKDRFQRVLELSSDDFRFDPEYPDLSVHRTDDFLLIEARLIGFIRTGRGFLNEIDHDSNSPVLGDVERGDRVPALGANRSAATALCRKLSPRRNARYGKDF